MGGAPVGRAWVVMMRNGTTAIDWGEGLFQDAISGEFFKAAEADVSHRASDVELDWLARVGRLDHYDDANAFFNGLSDLPSRSSIQSKNSPQRDKKS